jgi:predicted metalloendopeptidase
MNPLRHLAAAVLLVASAAPALAQAPSPSPNRAHIDPSCAPCKDFFQYANGAWLATAEIPPAYPNIGAGREMNDRNQATLKRVLDGAAAGWQSQSDPDIRKIGLLYATLMDSARADREGIAPLAAELKRLDDIRDRAGVRSAWARMATLGLRVPVAFGPEYDPENSSQNIAQFWQGGLGMPDRDYYFRQDEKTAGIRDAYRRLIVELLTLSGTPESEAKAEADRIMALETALAESSLTRVQLRDPKALYHPMTMGELTALAPAVDWRGYFREVGADEVASGKVKLDVSMPSFMRALDAQFANTPVSTWRSYLRFHLLRVTAPWIGQRAFDASFAYTSKITGTKEPLPRWKRAAQACDQAMGDALGKAYVATEFPPESKARMLEMVKNLRAAFAARIQKLTWMSDTTKRQAKRKLDAFIEKIGYPEKWKDYSTLAFEPSMSGIEMLRAAQLLENGRELKKIGKPVDRHEWGMTPPTVNAYYNPPMNEIVFPAGILQPPQFDPRVDDAVNYGAIGMVIGHELTHGFDDEGRQYDAEGNLKDWWTEEDAKRFDERAKKVVDQYDGYVAVDSLRVNGKLTLGENIADLGGIQLAYDAWKLSLKGKPAPQTIDGFTPEQRFYLSYAQSWRRKMRPEFLRTMVQTDPHSPAMWRVNGPLSNDPEFRRAFNCKAGDPMVRPDELRAEIW